jgi:hypothetical protein
MEVRDEFSCLLYFRSYGRSFGLFLALSETASFYFFVWSFNPANRFFIQLSWGAFAWNPIELRECLLQETDAGSCVSYDLVVFGSRTWISSSNRHQLCSVYPLHKAPLHCSPRWIEPGPERHIFSTTILQGAVPFIKTSAELKLKEFLQVAHPLSGQPTRAKSNKPHDFKPRLLLMGLRRYEQPHSYFSWAKLIVHRSGKSSIASVVFHKMPPNETLFLESTTRIQKDSVQWVRRTCWS